MFHSILRKKYRRAVGTHNGPTRMHQAGFSPRSWRDCKAGTTIMSTILQLTLAFYDRTQALLSDYGPARAAGAWATPQHPLEQQDSSRDYGPDGALSGKPPPSCWYRRTFPTTGGPGAADAAVDSAEAAVPSEELRAGRIRWISTPRQADDTSTRPSRSGQTRQSDARDSESSSTCQGHGPKRPGRGRVPFHY